MTTGSGQEQPITRDVLLDARLAQAKDTHRVQVRRIRIIPGHLLGPDQEPELSFPAG